MADTFNQSFSQGLNLAHTIENDKRLQKAQEMQMQMQLQQQQYQQMQMLKMAHDMAKGEEYTLSPEQTRYRNVNGEAKEVARGGPKPAKEFNVPAEVDTFLMTRFPKYASDEKVRAEATNWLSSPEGRKEYDSWWTGRKQTGPTVINYIPTSDGIIPLPSRGGKLPPIGKPVEGPSGLLGKPLPAGEMTKLSDLETLLSNVEVAKRNFDKSYVGPVAGRMGGLKEQVVDLPEKQVTFYAAVRDAKDALLRARSGAQINEQEYQRLVKFLPDENLPSGNFVARMNRFEAELKTTISVKRQTLKSGGYGTGDAPSGNAPNSNYPPTTNTLPQGAQTGKYNGEPAYSTDGGKTIYHALTNKRLK